MKFNNKVLKSRYRSNKTAKFQKAQTELFLNLIKFFLY